MKQVFVGVPFVVDFFYEQSEFLLASRERAGKRSDDAVAKAFRRPRLPIWSPSSQKPWLDTLMPKRAKPSPEKLFSRTIHKQSRKKKIRWHEKRDHECPAELFSCSPDPSWPIGIGTISKTIGGDSSIRTATRGDAGPGFHTWACRNYLPNLPPVHPALSGADALRAIPIDYSMR